MLSLKVATDVGIQLGVVENLENLGVGTIKIFFLEFVSPFDFETASAGLILGCFRWVSNLGYFQVRVTPDVLPLLWAVRT